MVLIGAGAALPACLGGRLAGEQPAPRVETLTLPHPDGRQSEYRIVVPAGGSAWPVVLFSHGANSSNADYDGFWLPWAARGHLVIGANHIDTGPPATQRKVGHGELWRSRVADALLPVRDRAPFDALAARQGARLEWQRVCAAGHSFGAVVAQALAGATLAESPGDLSALRDGTARVAACIALSPPGTLAGFVPADAWESVRVPSLLQTGDRDVLPGFVDDWHLRTVGFAGRPDRWTLVGHGVDHYFGGLICRRRPDAEAELPALRQSAALTGDFLEAYLRGRAGALRALRRRAALGDDGLMSVRPA